MNRLIAHRVAVLYREGVAAVARTDQPWDRPACGTWTAAETVRHVAAVARWYHDWLDRALAGDITRPFDGATIDERNATDVDALSDVAPHEAMRRFVDDAGSYLDRALPHWDLAFAYPFGITTVGDHLGLAATEWHLHAWDLDQTYRPSDPAGVFIAAATGVAATKPAVTRMALRLLIPIGARSSPWKNLLRRSGRQP